MATIEQPLHIHCDEYIKRLENERDELRATLDDLRAATDGHMARCPLAREAWAFIGRAVDELGK